LHAPVRFGTSTVRFTCVVDLAGSSTARLDVYPDPWQVAHWVFVG
jgi:hypothetical protein